MRKFTLPAGTTNRHKWHKKAADAVAKVARTFDMQRELYGTLGGEERESLVTIFSFGVDEPRNPEAVAIYDALGERHGWQITRENADAVARDFQLALSDCMETVPIDDQRTTPEQDAERDEKRREQQAGQQVIADAKADTVEQLAEALRKQYPDAIGPDSGKSSHARAAANLKRILQAQGLRVSVKSDSFSMGNSVRCKVLTPDLTPERRKEIAALCDLFTYGTFDAMTDSSGYDRSDEGEAWELVHGRAKYCHADCERSEENRAAGAAFLGEAAGSSDNYQLWTGAHDWAAEFWAKWAEDHKQPEPEAVAQGGNFYSIEKHHHSKRGFDFWLVVMGVRLEREQFNILRNSCKAAGGWYSRKWASTPGGFAFKEQEQAGAWAAQEFSGPDGPPDDKRRIHDAGSAHTYRGAQLIPLPEKAEKFRAMADKLADEVTAKRGDHQENTPKRQREGMSRRIDADRLERTAQALRALADLYEAGAVPELLRKFSSKKAIFAALGVRTESSGYYNVTATDERTDTGPEAVALWGLLSGKDARQERAEKLHNMEQAVAGSQIPGYFATPPDIVALMLDHAKVEPTHSVLEPSAGSGAILDALPAECLTVVNEINPALCEILQAKGFDARPVDFLETNGAFRFDRVLMNPPFENLQDIDHVLHAFGKLKNGGRLVSIMSPGPFFRDTLKCQTFRDWFGKNGGEVHDIEAGAFKASGTGVAAKLVIIDRNEAEPAHEAVHVREVSDHLAIVHITAADSWPDQTDPSQPAEGLSVAASDLTEQQDMF
jgi:hypothetical protein